MEELITRAHILIQQKRYVDAEDILKNALHSDPNNIQVLVLLTEVNLQLEQPEKAQALVDTALGLAPDYDYLYYLKARIALHQDKYDEAESLLRHAVQLDPADASYHAMWAHIKLLRKDYELALQMADKALEFDAENILALNTRSTALVKLDRKEEAFTTIYGALNEDPNNAYTHANYGWSLLEKGDHKKALEHFREALKNDPNFEYARQGMAEAIKASNPVYRLFLKYSFWISNLTQQYQWAVIIGFYFGQRFLRGMAKAMPQYSAFIMPVVFLMALIAFSTWVIQPISNLFLRFNKFGRHLLTRHQIMSSNFVAVSFAVFALSGITYLFTFNELFLVPTGVGFAMMLPLGSMFSASKYKGVLIIYAVVMAGLGLSATIDAFKTGEVYNAYTGAFAIGFIIYQWVANFFIIREDNV